MTYPVSADGFAELRLLCEKAGKLERELRDIETKAILVVERENGIVGDDFCDLWEDAVGIESDDNSTSRARTLARSFPIRDRRHVPLAEFVGLDEELSRGPAVIQFLIDWFRHDTLKTQSPVIACGLPMFTQALCSLLNEQETERLAAVLGDMRKRAAVILDSEASHDNRTDEVAMELLAMIENARHHYENWVSDDDMRAHEQREAARTLTLVHPLQ